MVQQGGPLERSGRPRYRQGLYPATVSAGATGIGCRSLSDQEVI